MSKLSLQGNARGQRTARVPKPAEGIATTGALEEVGQELPLFGLKRRRGLRAGWQVPQGVDVLLQASTLLPSVRDP